MGGRPGVGGAKDIQVRNHYSGKVDRTGIALCEVRWRQTLRLESAVDEDCPPTPDDPRVSGDVTT